MKQIRVLHYTTQKENCGIGKYQEQFLDAMAGQNAVHNELFPYSPNKIKLMSQTEFSDLLDKLAAQLEGFDILHIQHEYSFFNGNQLQAVIERAKSRGVTVLVTVHTALEVGYHPEPLQGFGPHSLLHYWRVSRRNKTFLESFYLPLKQADAVIVHNEVTKQSLMNIGVAEERIRKIRIPVPDYVEVPESRLIKTKLHYQEGDVIFSTVGFVSEAKGMLDAVRALSFLPAKYKLAIIGGTHPAAADPHFMNTLCDWIVKLRLQSRVYITGYVEDDAELGALIRECGACVYPFNKEYYSYVSSASLNNAIANHRPVIAYPTKPFIEMNADEQVLQLTQSFDYYELVRALTTVDFAQAALQSKRYAQKYAYSVQGKGLISIYRELAEAV